jgi:hypothetical protein
VSQVSRYYQSDLRASDAVTATTPTDASWSLGVNYENAFRGALDSASSSFDPAQASWSLGVNYENTLKNISDSTS